MTHEEFIESHLRNKEWHIKDGILYVDGTVYIEKEPIPSLPKRLSISNDLWLYELRITSLSEELFIDGSLFLQDTNITSLPEGFSIGGDIFSDKKLLMTEQIQINLIQQNKFHFNIIKNPTKKAITMYNLLWKI